jgi:glycosyltransferase involved in cell wall biosynthesis
MKLRGPARPLDVSSLYHRDYYRAIASDLRSREIDVAHIHSIPQASATLKAAAGGLLTAVHLHVEWLSRFEPSVMKSQLASVDRVFACSDFIHRRHGAVFPEEVDRFRTIFNGVDTAIFGPENDGSPPAQSGAPRLLYVGRISPEKGIHHLLEALPTLVDEFPGLELDIIGPNWVAPPEIFIAGSSEERLQSLRRFYDRNLLDSIKRRLRQDFPRRLSFLTVPDYFEFLKGRLEASSRGGVRFHDLVPNDELPSYYRRSDLLVLPSLYETFGIPAVEAMSCAIPVVATRVGGIPEVVKDGETGVLVDSGDSTALAETIATLLRDPERRAKMGAAGRADVLERFSYDRVADSLLDAYTEMVASGR